MLRLRTSRSAYTLMELVVASTVGAMLLGGMASSVYVASQALDLAQGTSATKSGPARALEQIVGDLRHAQHFSERTATAMTFTVPDRTGDGVPETIRYAWSGTTGDPLTYELNGASGGNLLEAIDSVDFNYLTRTIAARPINISAEMLTLVYIVHDANSPSNSEQDHETQFASWGYNVVLLDEAAAASEYSDALTEAAVVFVSGEIANANYVGGKIAAHGGGIVSETAYTAGELGVANSGYFANTTVIRIDDNTHPITSSFDTGDLTILNTDRDLMAIIPPMAGGADSLASAFYTPLYYCCLPAVEVGGALTSGGSAAGRRVQLPCSDEAFEFDELTAEGVTLWKNAVVWAGELGAPEPAGVKFLAFSEAKAVGLSAITVALPEGTTAGDLLIAAVATDGGPVPLVPPAGWNEVTVQTNNSRTSLGVWWKLADAAEPTDPTFTWAHGEDAYAWIMRFSGHDPAAPINAFAFGTGQSNTPVAPTVTTTVDNAMILRLVGLDDDDVVIDEPGMAGHVAITMDESTASSSSASGGGAYQNQQTAGDSGTAAFTLDSGLFGIPASEEYVTVTIAIAPEPEATP